MKSVSKSLKCDDVQEGLLASPETRLDEYHDDVIATVKFRIFRLPVSYLKTKINQSS
jgi:hypothetical protein